MEKQCTICKKMLALSLFDKSDNNIRNQCKICRYERTKEIREQKKIKNQNTDITKKFKDCIICHKRKEVKEFNRQTVNKDSLSSYCRVCFKEKRKLKNKEVIENSLKIEKKTCTKCFVEKSITEFRITNKSNDGHFHTCNACWKPREWNKEKQKAAEKKYVKNNPEKIREKYRKQGQKINRRIRNSLNKRIISALMKFSKIKEKYTMEYTGCSMEFLKKWFEFLFVGEMNWDNYGLWHIDHVIPCASFDLTDNNAIQSCFNWQNLRPCWGEENQEKSSQLISEVIENQKEKVKQFMISSLPNQPGDRVGGTE